MVVSHGWDTAFHISPSKNDKIGRARARCRSLDYTRDDDCVFIGALPFCTLTAHRIGSCVPCDDAIVLPRAWQTTYRSHLKIAHRTRLLCTV